MTTIIKALAPAILLGLIFLIIPFLPEGGQNLPPSMTEALPLGLELEGWRAERRQESERERSILAKDTRFSKADYYRLRRVYWEKQTPPVHVSLVFSGSDLNNSIHRPERCLPSQGHINLQSSVHQLTLKDGRQLTLTRLGSTLPNDELPDKKLSFIHYYVFVGNGRLTHNHIIRTWQDIKDRMLRGQVQSWAYFQAGTYWSPHLNLTEKEADATLQLLIAQLLPEIIKWEEIED